MKRILAFSFGIGLLCVGLAGCATLGIERVPASARVIPHLTTRLTVVSWNTQKGQDASFRSDLHRLLDAERPDLLMLQEAHAALATGTSLPGVFAKSWRLPWPGSRAVGVATLSSLPPLRVEALRSRHRELWMTAPKTSLVTAHRLGDGRTLLAANVHLLVFQRFSTTQIAAQLADLRGALAFHTGPLLLAGDFNSWSQDRLDLVDDLAADLELREVPCMPDGRRTGDLGAPLWNWMFGVAPGLALDRVFYRGLEPVDTAVLDYRSSDHAPIRVTFALATPDG